MNIHIVLFIFIYYAFVTALREVHILTPVAVKKGENTTLYCWYDTEGDPLYIVKWYKSGREFYRYVPQENPSIKLFPVGNLRIKVSESNATQVTLIDVDVDAAGSFSCEVSADAPSFQTAVVSGTMNVVELPLQRPVISGLRSKYRMNDVLKLNCSSSYSRPPANLTWYINNKIIESDVKSYPNKNISDGNISISNLLFRITKDSFIHSKIKVRCSASVYDIYWQSTEVSAEEDTYKQQHKKLYDNVYGINYHQPPPNFQLEEKKLDREVDVKVIGNSGSIKFFITYMNSFSMILSVLCNLQKNY